MALDIRGTVKDVQEIEKNRKDNSGTFKLYKVTLTDKESLLSSYEGIVTKDTVVPFEGNKVHILYNDYKTATGQIIHNIVKLNITDSMTTLTSEELREMTKTTKTANHTTTSTADTNPTFFKIQGKSFYAHIQTPDTKGEFPTNKYKLDLVIDDKTASMLKARGVQIKNKDERGNFVIARSAKQPTVLDNDGNKLETVPLIGNQSDVTLTVGLYKNKAKQGGDMCLGLNVLQLNNLIEYKTPLLTDLDE